MNWRMDQPSLLQTAAADGGRLLLLQNEQIYHQQRRKVDLFFPNIIIT